MVPVTYQWLMNRVAIMARREVIHELSNVDSYQGWSGYIDYCMPSIPAEESNSESLIWHRSLAWLDCGLARLIILHTLHHRRDWTLSSVAQIYILNMDLPSLHTMLFPELTSVNSHSVLSTIMKFHIILPLTKEYTVWPKKWGKRLMLIEFSGLTIILTIQRWLD